MTQAEINRLAARRIAKARTQLLLNPRFVFWATCALHLKLVPYPGMSMMERGSIGTDGSNLYYDPDFIVNGGVGVKPDGSMTKIEPWTDDELMGVIAHEVSHAVKGHCWRRGSREPGNWNIAADRALNPELTKNGLTLPAGALNDPADFGRAVEEIYNTLPPPQPGSGNQVQGQPAAGAGMSGDVRDPSSPQPGQDPTASPSQSPQQRQDQLEALARKWELIARQAAQIAKAQGHLPLGSEHLIEPIRPHLDPYAMLRHFVSMCRRDDYSWARGSRRSLWRGLYLPSLNSEGVGELVVAIDTSGSTAAVVPLFLGFLNSILVEVKPEKVHFVECDAAIHHVTEFQAGEELPSAVAVHGFGGTSMCPIWEWAEENDIRPVCAVVLTDGQMSARDFGPDGGPGFPVLWVISDQGRVAPFGETVEMTSGD